jgi:hypothetical protein
MKFDLPLDIFLTMLTLACGLPAWIQMIRRKADWRKHFISISLLTATVLLAVFFENLTTFGPLTLDYSLRFAWCGCPLCLLGIVFERKQRNDPATAWILAGLCGTMVVWGLLVTMHYVGITRDHALNEAGQAKPRRLRVLAHQQ